MSYNITEYVIDGGLTAYVMVKKWHIYFKPFSCGSVVRGSNGRTHTYTQAHTNTSNKCNRRACNRIINLSCKAGNRKSGNRLAKRVPVRKRPKFRVVQICIS